jgi:phytoene dehydrogenase-like protein
MGKPPELTQPMAQVRELWGTRRVLRYMVGRFGKSVADYVRGVQSPVLRKCLENLFLPESPVFFISMLLALLADGQMGLLEGGCREFVGAIEKRYRELGGEVTYRATVAQILTEPGVESRRKADRAVGVRLDDGMEHRADVVVSAADGYGTLFRCWAVAT